MSILQRLDKTFITSLQMTLFRGNVTCSRKALLSSKYLTHSCSKHGVATARKKNLPKKIRTPKKVGHMEIIGTVIQVSKISPWELYRRTKDTKKSEVRQLLEKAGINPTERRIYRARRNLLILVKGGCSVEEAKACISLITVTPSVLLRKVTALKKIDFEVIHPDLIVTLIRTRVFTWTTDNWICDKFGFSQRRELIQAVFNLTADEFDYYKTKQKYFEKISDIPKLLKKVHLLLECGVTIEQIKSNFWLLDFSGEAIQKINSFQRSLPGVKLWLWILQTPKTEKLNFTEMPEEEKKHEQLLNQTINDSKIYNKNLYEILSLILDVDVEHLTEFHMMEKVKWEKLAEKLEFLLEHKTPSNDIVDLLYILNRGKMETMLEVVEMARKAVNQKRAKTRLQKLQTFLLTPQCTGNIALYKELAKLLNIKIDEITFCGLPDLWQADPQKMKENFDFLIKQGFSIEDIKSCALILGHSGNTIQKYLNVWKNRWQLKQFENDKQKYLNALQYLIEKYNKFITL